MNRGMVKTEKEIELIARGGRLLSRVLGKVIARGQRIQVGEAFGLPLP